MIEMRPIGGGWTPAEWFIVFRRRAEWWWANALAMGRYKHVMCFAFLPAVQGWAFFDVGISATGFAVVPDGQANAVINRTTADALVLRHVAPVVVRGARIKPAFLCTSAVAHLTGVRSSALRPDAFLRDCLAAGAEIVPGSEERDELRIVDPA